MKKALLYILILIAGVFIGILMTLRNTQGLLSTIYNGVNGNNAGNKISELYNVLDKQYVDSININKIDEATVAYALMQLDPHSSYIPKEDIEEANEQLNGSFSGVGIQFNIQKDTVYIIDVIPGGPAERAGILAGDRVVTVDDSLFVGKSINNEKVFKKLRGAKGTKIILGIVRRTEKEVLKFTLKRDDIPVNTVNAAHIVSDGIGYVNISSFGQNTYSETMTALAKVKKQGAKSVIIDLRGNAGGYLDAAVNILNEFLKRGDLIVYIQGRAYKRTDFNANGTGSFQDMKVAVLIDEFSGSASEIFAGAIQDNDRGLVIGRRSFGKGLVQQPYRFSDGSEARITIARYYTPSGRCIQKPYTKGDRSDYDVELWNRFIHGEFYNADSIHQNDTVKYKTVKGRTVYGGGGIMPDIFIPRDTIGLTPSFNYLVNHALIYQFALQYTDFHRKEMKQYKNWKDLENYLKSQNLVRELTIFAENQGAKLSQRDMTISRNLIDQYVNSYIVRNMLTEDDFYHILNTNDKTVQMAVKQLSKF